MSEERVSDLFDILNRAATGSWIHCKQINLQGLVPVGSDSCFGSWLLGFAGIWMRCRREGSTKERGTRSYIDVQKIGQNRTIVDSLFICVLFLHVDSRSRTAPDQTLKQKAVMYGDHLVNQVRADPPLIHDSTLHVILVISNYIRVQSRYRLFRQTYEHLKATPNVKVYVVEAAFGNRSYEVTSPDEPTHLQVRTKSEIWVKENLANLGVRLFPQDWKYMALVDADIIFRDPNWALEAIHQAQHFAALQPWESSIDLKYSGGVADTKQSFGWLQQSGLPMQRNSNDPYAFGHPGYAWVYRRDFWEAAKGLLDFSILGSADHIMAWLISGDTSGTSIHGKISDDFKQRCKEWQDRVLPVTHGQVGFTPGRIEHLFHGSKKNRFYRERWKILIDNNFEPTKDLYYDDQGLIQLRGKPKLEYDIMQYNRSRREDSIDD